MLIVDNHNSNSFLQGCQALSWLSESGGSALRSNTDEEKFANQYRLL